MHDNKEKEEPVNELDQEIWAIIDHNGVIEKDMTYVVASQRMNYFINKDRISGREGAIVTNDVADRILKKVIKKELK